MHGNWSIQVTQKFATRDQRFIVSGAATGNGVHPGVVGSPAVSITGTSWSLVIQNKNGAVWQNSLEKIQFNPLPCNGFSLASDDGGGAVNDLDFNDLVLFCTPAAISGATDYIVYGNVSYYEGVCLFNPCWRDWIVIDTPLSLSKALQYPILREYIQKAYPDRLLEKPVRVPGNPNPPDPPFTPLMLPVQDNEFLPHKEATLFRTSTPADQVIGKKDTTKREVSEVFTPVSSVTLSRQVATLPTSVDKIRLAGLVDKLPFHCNSNPYASALLRFVEYDRTAAELAGGAYSGTGSREILGNVITDSFGNYVFRFQRTDFQDATELKVDVAPGESFTMQIKPDIIVQVLDPINVNQVIFESGLYANTGTCKRVNICVPKSAIGAVVNPCEGQSIIQYIGNILVAKDSSGNRGGAGFTLHSSGRISGGTLKCAAFSGRLSVIGCRLTDPNVSYYTMRYFKPGTGWVLVEEDCWLPRLTGGSFINTSVRTIQSLKVDGGLPVATRCYINVETAPDSANWITSINLKAFLTTSIYTDLTNRGRVEFRFEGYNAAGDRNIDETIALYLDNHGYSSSIDPVITMGVTPLGNCALFTLPVGNEGAIENAPLKVRFSAVQLSGFMGSYGLSIGKGAVGGISIEKVGAWPVLANTTSNPGPGSSVSRQYDYTSTLHSATCPAFRGTIDESTDSSDFITIEVKPATTWLEPGQKFCAFRLRIDGHIRHTNGYSINPNFQSGEVLIGIQRP